MKTLLAGLAGAFSLVTSSQVQAQETVLVYLVDPQDQSELPLDPKEKSASERLDDLINDIQNEDEELSEKRRRLAEQVHREQREFVGLLDQFVRASFNRNDDNAEPEFVKIRVRIANLLFKAPTTRDFYERLYLINDSWLTNQNEIERFESLDRELQAHSIKMEANQKRIRTIIVGVTTVVGVGLGGYLSYQASQRILPVVANEAGLGSLAKYAGRFTIVLIGAGVGAAAGAYAGFLGSDLLFQNQREFLAPIYGGEDLREILDYIDGLNSKAI